MRQGGVERRLHCKHDVELGDHDEVDISAPAGAREQYGFRPGLRGGDEKTAVASTPWHGQRGPYRGRPPMHATVRDPTARESNPRTAGRSAARKSCSRGAARSSCATSSASPSRTFHFCARPTASSSCGRVMTRRPTNRSPSVRSDGESRIYSATISRTCRRADGGTCAAASTAERRSRAARGRR